MPKKVHTFLAAGGIYIASVGFVTTIFTLVGFLLIGSGSHKVGDAMLLIYSSFLVGLVVSIPTTIRIMRIVHRHNSNGSRFP